MNFDGFTPLQLAWRITWIAIRLALVLLLISRGHYFFYQGF